MTVRKLKKMFTDKGWIIIFGAKHDLAYNPETGQKIPIPRHKGDLPIGTAHKILKAGNLMEALK